MTNEQKSQLTGIQAIIIFVGIAFILGSFVLLYQEKNHGIVVALVGLTLIVLGLFGPRIKIFKISPTKGLIMALYENKALTMLMIAIPCIGLTATYYRYSARQTTASYPAVAMDDGYSNDDDDDTDWGSDIGSDVSILPSDRIDFPYPPVGYRRPADDEDADDCENWGPDMGVDGNPLTFPIGEELERHKSFLSYNIILASLKSDNSLGEEGAKELISNFCDTETNLYVTKIDKENSTVIFNNEEVWWIDPVSFEYASTKLTDNSAVNMCNFGFVSARDLLPFKALDSSKEIPLYFQTITTKD